MSGILQTLFLGAAAAVKDAYFNLTTLLLNTSSTNGAQNNAFLDSSGNGNHPTRNGNATQGTFTPFSQTGWGAYNVGTASYCQLNNSDYSISTGDFTIEFWMFVTSDKAATCFCSATSNPNLTVAMNSGSAGARLPYLEYAGATTFATAFSNYLNTWTHVAFVRSSGTVTVYQNGVAITSASKSGAVGTTANLYLMRNSGDAGQDFPGYISNFRICKAAVYTGNFTPTTTNFTTTSQGATSCQLLTFQDNRFVDNSTNAATVTPTLTQVQAFSPFAPTAAYDAAVVGGSGYFDGTGDYLSLAATSAFAWGLGDLTIECWLYLSSTGTDNGVWDFRTGDSGQLFLVSNSLTSLQLYVGGASAYSFSVTPNAWNHIAVVRNTLVLKTYLNGVQVGSVANATNFTATAGCNICSFFNGTQVIGAYISNFRAVKGTAVYTAAFTPPTAPLTAITNTSLLLSATNAGIFDSPSKNVLETVGSAQVSTTVSKWGTTSMYCPATNGNYFLSPYNQPNFVFGTGNFTVEAWLYPTAFTNNAASPFGYGVNGSGGTTWWNLEFNTSGTGVWIDADAGRITASTTLATNTWTHVAVVRTNTAVTLYYNGVSVGTSATIGNITGSATSRLCVMTGTQDNGGRQFIGYIDDLRITKGYARYTANFTPPTEAFPLQ
jgi:hypothetical protein